MSSLADSSRASRFGALLTSHVRAGVPLMGVQTDEETRTLDRLGALARELDRELHVGRAEQISHDWERTIEAWGAIEEPAILVGLDLHPLLSDPGFVRALRVLAQRLEERAQTLVLVAPELPVPRDLEREIVILDLPLPDAASLRRLTAAEGQRRELTLDAQVLDDAVRVLQGLTTRGAQRAV